MDLPDIITFVLLCAVLFISTCSLIASVLAVVLSRKKSEAKIDFSESADAVVRKICAFNPFPGAYFEFNGERFKILSADFDLSVSDKPGKVEDSMVGRGLAIGCGLGVIMPTKIQRQGRKPMDIDEFLRGFSFPVGTVLK